MRITVFGATGGTGRQLVQQAVDAGHTVTAVVRDPARLPIEAAGLAVVTADVFDPAALEPTVAGADRVISALGAKPNAKTPVRARGAEAIVAAMQSAPAGSTTEPTATTAPPSTTAPPAPTPSPAATWPTSCSQPTPQPSATPSSSATDTQRADCPRAGLTGTEHRPPGAQDRRARNAGTEPGASGVQRDRARVHQG
jgi:hypothetical protein